MSNSPNTPLSSLVAIVSLVSTGVGLLIYGAFFVFETNYKLNKFETNRWLLVDQMMDYHDCIEEIFEKFPDNIDEFKTGLDELNEDMELCEKTFDNEQVDSAQ